MGSRRRGGLDPVTMAQIELHSRMSVGAQELANGRGDEAVVVAELVGIVAGRLAVIDHVVGMLDRADELGLADWPPRVVCRRLLGRVRAVVDGSGA